ncbi:MAG: DUF952 domain-containing protein [Actinomycetota bacterium]|nr:DUF952 domain-containing protein [Actinomycetota bacterium]
MDRPLLHITTRSAWGDARAAYRAASLDDEGFIHCSWPHQVVATTERWYADADDLVLLVIQPDRVRPVLREEASTGGEPFPHVYGPVPVDAVIDVVDWRRGADGRYELPARLAAST